MSRASFSLSLATDAFMAFTSSFLAARAASAAAVAASLFSISSRRLFIAFAFLAAAALAPLIALGGRPLVPPVGTRLPRLVMVGAGLARCLAWTASCSTTAGSNSKKKLALYAPC
ncbi:unnamed protein product [Ectocarpus sp. CCAP 1310/34]|nr:unnamed protein product [Ectocarpus sp. CCAP 1310/34]